MTWCVWVSFSWERVNSHEKFEGKLKRFLKTDPLFAKHAFFATSVSRQQVARVSRQNTQSQNYEKFSKCFSRKVYPRVSRELSRENLCVPLATRPFTREQVTKTNPWARSCSMRLGWPATELPKQSNTVFEIFQFL